MPYICVQDENGAVEEFSISLQDNVSSLFSLIQTRFPNVNSYTHNLIYSNKILDINRKLKDYQISEYDMIFLCKKHGIIEESSGGYRSFVDVINGKTRFDSFGPAPKWRTVYPGLNLYGTCKYNQCEAFNQEVISPQGIGKFQLVKQYDDVHCPACKELIIPKTCGFYKCDYLFDYTQLQNGKQISGKTILKKGPDNSVEYFIPGNGKILDYLKLDIYTYSSASMDYK